MFSVVSVWVFVCLYKNACLTGRQWSYMFCDSTYCGHCGVLVSVNFGCFSPSRFSHFYCNAMTKTIKAHKNLHSNQQNEHTPGLNNSVNKKWD